MRQVLHIQRDMIIQGFLIINIFHVQVSLEDKLNSNYLTNYRIIRYSDVLLMAAEALNRGQIDDATALQYLNEVRERAFGSSDNNLNVSGSALTDAIWLERKYMS